MGHRGADLLQRDAGVEQALDHLEHADVAEAVEALGAGSVRRAHAGLHQAGPGPVVELTVGDPGGGAGRGAPVADIVGMDGKDFVTEQQALLPGVLHGGAACLRVAVVTPGYRHTCLRPGKSPPWVPDLHAKRSRVRSSTTPDGASQRRYNSPGRLRSPAEILR